MTENENKLFHKNYSYMWKKLSVTHYQILLSKNYPKHIINDNDLPSYAICSKCFKENFFPSYSVVNKIVSFYNKNLLPTVTTHQFLTEDLSAMDNLINLKRTVYDRRFVGIYYCYYPSATQNGTIIGGIMKIYESDRILKAIFISGIHSDTDLHSETMLNLLNNDHFCKENFDIYFQSLDITKQRGYYYEGLTEVTDNSLLIHFYGLDVDTRKLTFVLNIESYPAGLDRNYIGGLGFALATNDGPFETRFFQMGLIHSDYKIFSLSNPSIYNFLKPNTKKTVISLTSSLDRKWFEFILKNIEKH